MSKYILGINAYHPDSSAALIKDGVLIAAVEEERFTRIKHWSGFPGQAINFCLTKAKISINDIDIIAINNNTNSNFLRKFIFAIFNITNIKNLKNKIERFNNKKSFSKELYNKINLKDFQGHIVEVEHHLSHLSSAFYVSPFSKATVVSVDGFGDFASTAWGVGNNNKINCEGKIFFPHSLGIFYQCLTQFLGFYHFGDEYKVMGLAPYGNPIYLEQMKNIVILKSHGRFQLNLKFFKHHLGNVDSGWDEGKPFTKTIFTNELINLLGKARTPNEEISQIHKDIASSVQAMYELAFFNLLNYLYSKHGNDSIALAGGCAANSVANGKILLKTRYKYIYVQAAAGDAGGAIGSAFSAYFSKYNRRRNFIMDHSYWGPEYTNDQIIPLLNQNIHFNINNFRPLFIENESTLCEHVAKHISDGSVVGWFQGAMEWGPRALGNRSILCDPRRIDMKDILNIKIKRRESFRPFAPSIIKEKVNDWFEVDDNVPFMMQVYQIKANKRNEIPAVCHVDGSGRLQTVTELNNSRYYRLLNEFNRITGVPILLNTSFNENEPIVCTPIEAFNCFLRTNMDILVLNNYIFSRVHLNI